MYRILVEIPVSRSRAVDILPRGFFVEAQFVRGHADDRAIFVVGGFDEEGDAAAEERYCYGERGDAGE